MREINNPTVNELQICGRLSDITFSNGKLSDGRPWESATANILVTQTVNGVEETSTDSVKIFATPMTAKGTVSSSWQNIQEMKNWDTIQNVGFDRAQKVVANRCELQENSFVSTRSGQIISGFAIKGMFLTKTKAEDKANGTVHGFVLDLHEEVDKEGEETGRLIIRTGIVGYGPKLSIVEFIVEGAERVENTRRMGIEPNQTIRITYYPRIISKEESVVSSDETGGWGEEFVSTVTRTVRELMVTGIHTVDEEFSYDPDDIKLLFNKRKAELEQMQLAAKTKKEAPAPASTSNRRPSWE